MLASALVSPAPRTAAAPLLSPPPPPSPQAGGPPPASLPAPPMLRALARAAPAPPRDGFARRFHAFRPGFRAGSRRPRGGGAPPWGLGPWAGPARGRGGAPEPGHHGGH